MSRLSVARTAVACALVVAMPAGAARGMGQGGHGTHGGGIHGRGAACAVGQAQRAGGRLDAYGASDGAGVGRFKGRAREVERYYSDPASIGYVPYCDPASLYYDPESCDDSVPVTAGPQQGPASGESKDQGPGTGEAHGNIPEPYAGRRDLFGPVVPSRGAPGRAAGTYEEPGSGVSAVPYGTGGSRGYTVPDAAR